MALTSNFHDCGVQLGGSRGGPVGVRRLTFWLLELSWTQDGPQTTPRRLLGPILKDLGSQIGRFLVPTWLILEGFCIPSWRIFYYCLVGCSNGWLVSWLAGCLVGWLIASLIGCFFDWLVGWLVVGWLVAWIAGWCVDWLLGGWVHGLFGCRKP